VSTPSWFDGRTLRVLLTMRAFLPLRSSTAIAMAMATVEDTPAAQELFAAA
jgi:hypothetical protein